MSGEPEWLDARIVRAKQISTGLVPRLDAARPMLVKLVTAEPAPLGDLVRGTGALGQKLAAEPRPGLYAISARDAPAGESLHAGKVVTRHKPIRARVRVDVGCCKSNQGGHLLVALKLIREAGGQDKASEPKRDG